MIRIRAAQKNTSFLTGRAVMKSLVSGLLAAPLAPTIIPEFDDPFLELVRLVHEASEVEQSLMVQYLYAVFSVKDKYPILHGFPLGSSGTLFGVAVQEMVHLASVNQFLIALGVAPNFQREDFSLGAGDLSVSAKPRTVVPRKLGEICIYGITDGSFQS